MRGILITTAASLIVLICLGFLVIGIVQVKTASARIQCTNNLRQIGLSLANYGDTCNKLPTAAMENSNLSLEQRLSWMVSIQPYLEASSLYSDIDKQKGWEADENRFAAVTRLGIFHCPGYPTRPPESTLFPTHYLGLAGIGVDAVSLPEGDANAGVFGYDRQLAWASAQARGRTLMTVAETRWPTGAWTAAGPPTVRGLADDGSPNLGQDGQFGGIHTGGLNVLFADSSVLFLKNTMNPEVLEALVRIKDDGRVFNPDEN